MKAKLLKKLRAKFIVEYFPSSKQYRVSGERETFHNRKSDAIAQKECDMINYGRKYYREYSKHIRIQFSKPSKSSKK